MSAAETWRLNAGDETRVMDGQNNPICDVKCGGMSGRTVAQGEKIARLIAAAPALLDALEDARTSLSITRTNIMCEIGRCADPSESRWEGVPEQLAKRIAKIDAAISLAKGESA